MADSSNRVFLISIIFVGLVALAIFMQPTLQEQWAPEPEVAWVAIECGDDGVAEVGHVEPVLGEEECRLHAVLEARDRDDEPVYYTQAKRLSLNGEEVDSDRLRPWRSGRWVKIRWFTLEGNRPYVRLSAETGIQGFSMEEFLRSDWPLAWSIPAEIDAANDNHLTHDSKLDRQLFGTQRFHVRVEIYRLEDDLIPMRVVRSWGIKDLKEHIDAFPTLRVVLPGRLAPVSRVFGLTQLEPPPEPERQLLEQIEELSRQGIAFSAQSLLRDQIQYAERTLDDLRWQTVDLSGATARGDSAERVAEDGPPAPQAGDLVRVGDRVVILYDDQGLPGLLDYDDWCFDFVQGIAVRSLREVFSGEGATVEWASLAPRSQLNAPSSQRSPIDNSSSSQTG